jgi:hypothetical protein
MAAFGSVLFSSTIRKNAPAGMTERKARAGRSCQFSVVSCQRLRAGSRPQTADSQRGMTSERKLKAAS